MAHIDTTGAGAFGAARDTSLFGSLSLRFRAWQRARATSRALKGLSNAQLADIGIEAGDIDGFAERLAYDSLR